MPNEQSIGKDRVQGTVPEARRAAPVVPQLGERVDTNLKEALGRFLITAAFANDPLATLSPLLYVFVIPMLEKKGVAEAYSHKIKEWKANRDKAIRDWNIKTGMWKDAKILAEDTLIDVVSVAFKENLVVMNQAMMDLSDMVRRGPAPGE